MDGNRPRQPLTDSALDRELESALGIEPSPEFLARARTRVAAEPEPSSWRPVFEPLWAVAIVGLALAVAVPRWMRDAEILSKAVVGPIAEAVETPPIEAGVHAGQPVERVVVAAPVRHRPARVVDEVPLQLSTPLFSEEERRVFEQYFAAVETGRVPPRPAEPQASDSYGVGQVPKIEALVIDPLPQLSARVQTEGEAKW
jgi:hypothetical protein